MNEGVWRSIFPRPLAARTDGERAALTRFTFVLHLRPVLVPARTLSWTHTFGLGGSSLVLITLLAATGILNQLTYQPVPGVAYDSVAVLADHLIRRGRPDEALPLAERLAALYPDQEIGHRMMAVIAGPRSHGG